MLDCIFLFLFFYSICPNLKYNIPILRYYFILNIPCSIWDQES